MQEANLFLLFTKGFDQVGVEYMITGSVAAMVYGEPRLTHDVDLVIILTSEAAERLESVFSLDAFYCPPQEVIKTELARAQRGHFNLIHHETGYKADVYIMGNDPLHAWAWQYRKRIEVGVDTIMLAPAEYVIVRKLQYFNEGGSQKHLTDIRGILRVSAPEVDLGRIEEWVTRLGLADVWSSARLG